MGLRKIEYGLGGGLNVSEFGQGKVPDSCLHDNETAGSIKGE
jgi:hypothetical protein